VAGAACLGLWGSWSRGYALGVAGAPWGSWSAPLEAGLGRVPGRSVDHASSLSYEWGPGLPRSHHSMYDNREGSLVSITAF